MYYARCSRQTCANSIVPAALAPGCVGVHTQVKSNAIAEEHQSKRLRTVGPTDAEAQSGPEMSMVVATRQKLDLARRAYLKAVQNKTFVPTLECLRDLLMPCYPELYRLAAGVAHTNAHGVPTRRQSVLDRARERRAVAAIVHVLETSSERVHFLQDEFSLQLVSAGDTARRAASATGIGRSVTGWFDLKNTILHDLDAHTYEWAERLLSAHDPDRVVFMLWGDDITVSCTTCYACNDAHCASTTNNVPLSLGWVGDVFDRRQLPVLI